MYIVQNEKEVQLEPTYSDLRNIKRAVRMNSVIRKQKKGKDHVDRSSVLSNGIRLMYIL